MFEHRVAAVTSVLGVSLMAAFGVSLCASDLTVPQTRDLIIPVAISGPPSRSLECVLSAGPPVPISAVAFSPDGKTLAVGGYREVLVWDLAKAKLARRIGSGQLGTMVGAVTFLPAGNLVAVGEGTPHKTGSVRIFDITSGQQTAAFDDPADVVSAVAVSPDGKLLAAGGAEAVARVWNIAEKKLVATLSDHSDWVLGVCFSPDGKSLATASADKTTLVWDVATWKSTVKLVENASVRSVAFGPDSKSLAVAVRGHDLWAVRLRRSDNVRSIRNVVTGVARPVRTVWAAKKKLIFVPCTDNAVRVIDTGGRIRATLVGHTDWVYAVAISADEARLASASADGTVKLWNVADNKLLATLVQTVPGSDEWAIVSTQGYITAASPDRIRWKTQNLKTPAEQLPGLLVKPDFVRDALAGEKTAAPTLN